MYGHFTGQVSHDDLMATYRARDKQLVLDVESNCFLVLGGVDQSHIEAMLEAHCAGFIERRSLAQLWR